MRWWVGAAVVMLVSALAAGNGVRKLIQRRKWISAALYMAGVFAYPYAFAAVLRLENSQLRFWLGVPIAVIAPVWLFSGIFIRSYDADRPETGSHEHKADYHPCQYE